MKNNMAPILTGVAVSAAVGTAAYMMSGMGKKSAAKNFKKNAGKAVRAVGDVVDTVSYMMK
ncbi:MAG: hypothetical protein IKV41_03170 [Oscillospiraceae bacterium]|nr:hypothetical protein [Oscillospiraceae bacterium]